VPVGSIIEQPNFDSPHHRYARTESPIGSSRNHRHGLRWRPKRV